MVINKVIMHNSISLDGSFTDFKVNMGLHYQIAGRYRADATLIGANTIFSGCFRLPQKQIVKLYITQATSYISTK